MLKSSLTRRVEEKQEKQRRDHERPRAQIREFHDDVKVLVRDYTGGKEKWMQGTVIKKLGVHRYLGNLGRKTRHCHVDQMLKSYVKPSSQYTETEESNRTRDTTQGIPLDNPVERPPYSEPQAVQPREIMQPTEPRSEVTGSASSSIGETPAVIQSPVPVNSPSAPAQSTTKPTIQGLPSPRRNPARDRRPPQRLIEQM